MFPSPVDQDWRKKLPPWAQQEDTNPPTPMRMPPPVGAGVTMPGSTASMADERVAPTPVNWAAPPRPVVDTAAPDPGAMPPPVAPSREALTGQNVGGVQVSAPMPPAVKAQTPEQDKLKAMTQMGPKTSVLGTLAGLGMRAAAGWASTPGRPPRVNEQRMQDWSERNPMGGGSWREGIAQQGQLAGMEQGEVARQQAAAKSAAENAHLAAQTKQAAAGADYYGSHARTNEQDSATRLAKEQDEKAKADADRLLKEKLAKQTAASNKIRLTMAQAKEHDIVPTPEEEQQGYVEMDRRLWGRLYSSDNTAESAAAKRDVDEAERKLRHNETQSRIDESKANTDLRRRTIQDTEETKAQGGRDRAQASIEKLQKEEQGYHAQREAYGQRIATIKQGATVIDPKTGMQVVITSQNADAIRMAYQEKYDQATAEAQRTHEAQRKLIERHGGEAGAALNLKKTPAAATSTATATDGGGAAAAAPAPAAAKVWPRARLQGYADSAFGGDAAKTEQYLKSQGYVIQ